jgi:lipopolysaccharide/colanic/teichoic acid biosynthesis glycosyltransferase
MLKNVGYVPLLRDLKFRTAIGFFLLALSLISTGIIIGKGHSAFIALICVFAWMISVFFTDKYVHKYPQRYFTYLIASHIKAAMIMSFFLFIICMFASSRNVPPDVLWAGFLLFVFIDAIASVPRRRDILDKQSTDVTDSPDNNNVANYKSYDSGCIYSSLSLGDSQAVINKIPHKLDISLVEFIKKNLPYQINGAGEVVVIDDINTKDPVSKSASVNLLIGRTCINDVLRLNHYFQFCTELISMGGYFVIRYLPFENYKKNLMARYKGAFYWIAFILHFIWYRAIPKIPWLEKLYFTPLLSWLDTIHLSFVKRRNRPLSKAEVWGRLSFWGMEVCAESSGNDELFIIAQRIARPVQNKVPSFYMIAALEKVGLKGQIIHTHKIRTMYPFSEFLQQRVFEDHGLAATGKFANDFRLTDYGSFLRKYWLDELPQIFDWLRGDIKLVGLRATSQHFLSLYPKEFYDLYIQIKPGLIPPIFDENTNGFDQIVDVELRYLKSYWEQPIQTDIRYFCKTFTDIIFRGVRSK